MKNILKHAPHYDEIVSVLFKEDDFITKRIINYYQEYLFGVIKSNNYRIRVLDKIIYEWTKKGYKTVEDVINNRYKKEEKDNSDSYFFEYNWLDEN